MSMVLLIYPSTMAENEVIWREVFAYKKYVKIGMANRIQTDVNWIQNVGGTLDGRIAGAD